MDSKTLLIVLSEGPLLSVPEDPNEKVSPSQNWYYFCWGVLALAILGFDLMLPLGVAAGVPYMFLVLLAWKASNNKFLLIAAITGTLFTLAGWVWSPSGGEMWKVLANRLLALVAIWGCAFLIYRYKNQERELARTTARYKEENVQRARAEENLKKSESQLRELCSHMESVREEERLRVAREIHDELGQVLTTVKLEIAVLRDSLPADILKTQKNLEDVLAHADHAIQTVKKISSELRPFVLDNLGLREAVEHEVEKFEQRTRIPCDLILELDDQSLELNRAIAIFRIFQETLTNVIRHAQASRMSVSLKHEEGVVRMTITDDGRGITRDQIASKEAFGLIGMRERALAWGGEFSIHGLPGGGTEVKVLIPAPREPAAAEPSASTLMNF